MTVPWLLGMVGSAVLGGACGAWLTRRWHRRRLARAAVVARDARGARDVRREWDATDPWGMNVNGGH